jgi:hypothetical protein
MISRKTGRMVCGTLTVKDSGNNRRVILIAERFATVRAILAVPTALAY